MSSSSPSLLDRFRRVCRRRHFSRHTEQSYRRWVIRYVRFHDTTHPRAFDATDVRTFLNHLAVNRDVAAATQNQTLNALVFLYDDVLERPLGEVGAIERADRPNDCLRACRKQRFRPCFARWILGPMLSWLICCTEAGFACPRGCGFG